MINNLKRDGNTFVITIVIILAIIYLIQPDNAMQSCLADQHSFDTCFNAGVR